MTKEKNEPSSFEEYLSIQSHEKNLSGLRQMFDDSDSSDEEEENEPDDVVKLFNLSAMEEFTLQIANDDPKLSFSLVQSQTAFGQGDSNDRTGNVLWGASFHLSQYLTLIESSCEEITKVSSIKGKSILELGCGTALNSLTAARLGAGFVIATDYEEKTLAHAQHHLRLNQEEDNVHTLKLDWDDIMERTFKDEKNDGDNDIPSNVFIDWSKKNATDIPNDWRKHLFQNGGFELIIASDVIYGVNMVLPLVVTIQNFLEKNGVVIIATRDGRRGVEEFRQAMKAKGSFDETYALHISQDKIVNSEGEIQNDEIPVCFRDDVCIGRWKAAHSIYVYKRSSMRE